MYRVSITAPNRVFFIKGMPVRSPFVAEVTDDEIDYIMTKIRQEGLPNSDFNIERVSKKNTAKKLNKEKSTPIIDDIIVDEKTESVVEEFMPNTILEKLMYGEDESDLL